MSTKSNGIKQELKKANARIANFKKVVQRMDEGAAAILAIAKIYGRHLASCALEQPPVGTPTGEATPTEGAEPTPTPKCTCDWEKSVEILSGVTKPAVPVAPVVEPVAELTASVVQ